MMRRFRSGRCRLDETCREQCDRQSEYSRESLHASTIELLLFRPVPNPPMLTHMSAFSCTMARTPGSARALTVALVVAVVVFAPTPADAVGGEGESWPSFNESNGCGSVWMRGPNVEVSGYLPGSTELRGPHADYVGRTIGQVWDSLR